VFVCRPYSRLQGVRRSGYVVPLIPNRGTKWSERLPSSSGRFIAGEVVTGAHWEMKYYTESRKNLTSYVR